MTTMTVLQYVAQSNELGTGGVKQWIIDNIIPLVFLGVALLLFTKGRSKGDMSAVGQIVVVSLIGLAFLGFATGAFDIASVGKSIATMFAG